MKLRAIMFLLACGILCGLVAPEPSRAQLNTTCQDIQTGAVNDSIALRLRGVLVTGVRRSGASGGFWVQDRPSGGIGTPGDPFSGIFCFTGSNPAINMGDSVTVVGMYNEFFEQSELNMRDCKVVTGVDSSTIVHKVGATLPGFVDLTACQLTPDSILNSFPAETWEGVLVRLDSVRVKTDGNFGEWTVEEADGDSTCVGRADTCIIDDKFLGYQQPPVASMVRILRGIQDETFAQPKLQPRGDFDIFISPLPAPAPEFAYVTDATHIEIRWTYPLDPPTATSLANYSLLSGNFSITSVALVESTLVRLTTGTQPAGSLIPEQLDIANVKNRDLVTMSPASVFFISGVNTISFVQTPKGGAGLDTSRVVGRTVCVAGVVTAGTNDAYFSNAAQFFIEQTGGGANSGIRVSNTGGLGSVVRGDSVRVSGLVTESFGTTSIGILDYVIKVGTKAVPGPDVVSFATAKSEPYEGVFVRVNGNLAAIGPWSNDFVISFNEVPLIVPGAPLDTLRINDSDGGGYAPLDSIASGDTLCFIQGPADFDFGNRRILPRNLLDMCFKKRTGVEEGEGLPPIVTRLDQNVPNPFNPRTKLTFAISRPGHVALSIFDITGREVRTLVDERLKAGEYARDWDGRDTGGREVASGVYFYKLVAPGFENTRKMVLLK